MKRFNRYKLRASAVGESGNFRSSSLSNKRAQRHYTAIIGTAICAVIVLHFVSQFVFFRDEKPALPDEAMTKQSVEIKPEYKPAAKIKTETAPPVEPKIAAKPNKSAKTTTVNQPQPAAETVVPTRAVIKKKAPAATRAERLRRAERILTGI